MVAKYAERFYAKQLPIVEENGKYPMTWNIDEPFDGGLIEKIEAGHYKLTWKAEIGICRFEIMSKTVFFDENVVAKEVAMRFFQTNFDGIPIDWTAKK